MRQRSLPFLIFSLFWVGHLSAQTAAACYRTAEGLEQSGDYKGALRQYERIRYFKPDTLLMELNMHIGNCQLYIGEYYPAMASFEDALIADFHHAHQNEINLQKLKAEVLARNMRYAAITIREIDTLHDEAAKKEVYFYQGVIHFFTEKYAESEDWWLKLVPHDTLKRERIQALFLKNDKINRLKPGVAIALSIVLPGAGQIYAGDFKEGINSLLLNGFFFFLGYNTVVAYQLLNAVIAVGPWLFRYYEGGFLRAGEIVKDKRAQRHQAVYKQVLEILQP